MPKPNASELHVDVPLTNIAIGAKNTKYIVNDIFPTVTVPKQSNIVPSFDRSHWFRNDATQRALGTKSVRGGFSVKSSDTYFCKEHSFGYEVPDQVRENQDQPWDIDRHAVEFVTDKIEMAKELYFATNHFTTSVWGADWTGAAATGATSVIYWSTYASSSPLLDIDTFKDTVEADGNAVEPNVLVMGKQVWLKLKWHPDVIDTLYKGSVAGLVDETKFANLIDIPKVLIGRALYTTSPEVSTTAYGTTGAGTDNETLISYTRAWGKHALLLYVPPSPSIMAPAAGYTFVWQRVPNAGLWIKRMRDEERQVDIIEANSNWDMKVTDAGAGLFLSGAVA